jgi:hypothetical protein
MAEGSADASANRDLTQDRIGVFFHQKCMSRLLDGTAPKLAPTNQKISKKFLANESELQISLKSVISKLHPPKFL